MPRSLVLGNGNLLIALDQHNMLEDFYYPYVGMEDQIAFQHMHRVGIFTDNRFSWLYQDPWKHEMAYIPDTLVSDSTARNAELGLEITFNDFVYPTENAFIRKLTIKNDRDGERTLNLFFGQDFHIYGDKQQDTAFYEPTHKAVVHYRKRRYFWISGLCNHHKGVDSFTTGKSEYRWLEGTWRDAEDGHLHENPIEQGSVDSTVQFNVTVPAHGTAELFVWVCAGKDLSEVTVMHKFILDETPEKLMHNSINYWKSWVNKQHYEVQNVPAAMQRQYKQSLLIMRTQIDNRGAIIAANDSDIMKFNKDTYTYMWPRDGAWVSLALDQAGYGEISKRFFRFCSDVASKEGYLMHKYNPDQSLGSSWHPWFYKGEIQTPIQEDETALVVHALYRHFQLYGDIEFAQEMYPFIRRAGNFMMNFTDKKTGLPKPSWDLWEREQGVFAYTAAVTYSGLWAAAHLSEVLGHFNHHRRYEMAAARLREAILKYFYDETTGRFAKSVRVNPDTGAVERDMSLDASLHGLWLTGFLPPDDPRVVKTMEAVRQALYVNTPVGGLARFENDDYQRVGGDYHGVPGNPWIITTLWHAQWLAAVAKKPDDLKQVEMFLDWAMGHMNKGGILPEQLSPFNGEHLSVAPLTWSHAAFVETVQQYQSHLKHFM